MKSYILISLIALTLFSIPVSKLHRDAIRVVCDKCQETNCPYYFGEQRGFNEEQVETILFTLQKLYK